MQVYQLYLLYIVGSEGIIYGLMLRYMTGSLLILTTVQTSDLMQC